MADNKVKFLRGTAAEYAASTKDNDVFYYITDTQKLYLGANEVTGVGKAGTGASAEIFNDYTQNKANGNYSHAEGLYTKADGSASHSEGAYTDATGDYSHTEGYSTTASKFFAHAGGDSSSALKRGAFVHGNNVIADKNDYETAFGTFNKSNADTLFSVGNGISTEDRSNAFEITKTTGKLFDKEIATKEDIPTTLPANGGNADTVGKKHPDDFFNNISGVVSPKSCGKNTLQEYIASISSATSSFYAEHFTDLPSADWGYNVTVNKTGGAYYAIAYKSLSDKEIYVRACGTDGTWNGEWARICDGGNADTLDGLHANEIASNPNLLLNPDFRVNQRGGNIYSYSVASGSIDGGFTVDHWISTIVGSGNSGSYNAETHILSGSVLDKNGYYANLCQFIENPVRFAGKTLTFSAGMSELDQPALIQIWRTEGTTTTGVAATHYNLKADKVLTFTMPSDLTEASKIRVVLQTRGSVKLDWAKLELGSAATPFVPPDLATELEKCQRFYQIRSTNDIDPLDLRPSMRTITDIKAVEGGYAYVAEL